MFVLEGTMKLEDIKSAILKAIDDSADEIIAAGRAIYAHPELGFKEKDTSALVQKMLGEAGVPYESGLALTGVKGRLKERTDKDGATVALMGELDSVICPLHEHADPATGAAHCCGHNGQTAGVLGAALGLTRSGVAKELCGNVFFMFCPAEECVEITWRSELIEQGKLAYLGGKQQLLHEGAFSDVDMAMIIHGTDQKGDVVTHLARNIGFLVKKIRFIGKEAHAGMSPELGVNALDACSLAISAINAARSTFRDSDCVKVHHIVTKGGDIVNVVPADVRMEMYVRARTIDAIKDANFKVNRALRGAAMAVGADVEVEDIPGYLPLVQNEQLAELFLENAMSAIPGARMLTPAFVEGNSTDAGDVSTMIPTIQAGLGGFSQGFHSKNFRVLDEYAAYVEPAKALALTAAELLYAGAEKAKHIKAEYKAEFIKEDYDGIWPSIMAYRGEQNQG